MDDSWAPQTQALPAGDGAGGWMQSTEAAGHADDPLGDEAAFPSTWQSLAGLETTTVD